MRIAVLMTCHNRKEATLRCLESLRGQEMGKGGFVHGLHGFSRIEKFDVFLNDDGCTDGTGEAVQDWFKVNAPLFTFTFNLHLIHGSGNDYWAKGMARAWRAAVESVETTDYTDCTDCEDVGRGAYDAFLWLNDDVVLKPDALDRMLQDAMAHRSASDALPVVVGACEGSHGDCTYGVVDSRGAVMDPRGCCDPGERRWLNGNVVLVPYGVYEKVGIISDEYSHGRADYDYAERLRRAGMPFVSSSKFVCVCDYNYDPKMRGATRRDRIALLFRPGCWNLRDLWLFRVKYYGKLRAVVSCAHQILNALR